MAWPTTAESGRRQPSPRHLYRNHRLSALLMPRQDVTFAEAADDLPAEVTPFAPDETGDGLGVQCGIVFDVRFPFAGGVREERGLEIEELVEIDGIHEPRVDETTEHASKALLHGSSHAAACAGAATCTGRAAAPGAIWHSALAPSTRIIRISCATAGCSAR